MRIPLQAAIAVASMVLGVLVAWSQLRFFAVDRWRQHRWISALGLCTGGFSGCNLLRHYLPPTQLLDRVQILLALGFLLSWFGYAEIDLGPLPATRRRLSLAFTLGGFVLFALPGVGLTDQLVDLPNLDLVLRTWFRPTLLGQLGSWGMAVAPVTVVLRYLDAALKRRPQAKAHLLCLGVPTVAGIHDLMLFTGLVTGRHLLDLGALGCTVALALVLAHRWVKDVRAREALSANLEKVVEERSRALEQTWQALGKAERQTAIGRLTREVAQHLAEPAARTVEGTRRVVQLLGEPERWAQEGMAQLREATRAGKQVTSAVKRLLEISRALRATHEESTFEVHEVTEQAARAAAREHGGVVSLDVPRRLRARGGRGLVLLAVQELIGASFSVARAGVPVVLRAEQQGAQIRLSVNAPPGSVEPVVLRSLLQATGPQLVLEPVRDGRRVLLLQAADEAAPA